MRRENESCKRILNYIKENPTLEPTKKRLLISYATQLYLNNVENIEESSIQDIFSDLRVLNDSLEHSENTTIVAKRLSEELKVFEMLTAFLENRENDLSDISFELDKLYLRSDLKVRKKSTLSYDLVKKKENGRIK